MTVYYNHLSACIYISVHMNARGRINQDKSRGNLILILENSADENDLTGVSAGYKCVESAKSDIFTIRLNLC